MAVVLLTACGQSSTDTASSPQKTAQTTQTASTTQPEQANALLASLAATYPSGQLPAASAAQAAKELTQNPAALSLTASSEPQTTPWVAQSTSALIQPQSTTADYKAVTRIQNTTLTGAYFFTIYDGERTSALATNPKWKQEGPAFWASLASGNGLSPVYRFRNNVNGSYLYTIYDSEKTDIQSKYAATYFYEGVAWYAQPYAGVGWSPLYRFRNILNGTYLFSAYEAEKDAIIANFSAVFKLEGVAYYVRQDTPTGYQLVANGMGGFYDKTECVKDNATGLIWQGQTAAGTGLRGNDQYKTNMDSTTALQVTTQVPGSDNFSLSAPTLAQVNASTNSIGFKNAVNAANLCGSGEWRLPTKAELLGLVKTTAPAPKIDATWFPNTSADSFYWTSSPDPVNSFEAANVDFYEGKSNPGYRSADLGDGTTLVRLVR